MTADDRDDRLTAYALNDPGLSAADCQEIETQLAADPAARQAVEETRQLARLLTGALAAEQAALPAEPAVTIPAPEKEMPTNTGWAKRLVAVAAVLAAVGGVYLGWTKWKPEREPRAPVPEMANAVTLDNSGSMDGTSNTVSGKNGAYGDVKNMEGYGNDGQKAPDPQLTLRDSLRMATESAYGDGTKVPGGSPAGGGNGNGRPGQPGGPAPRTDPAAPRPAVVATVDAPALPADPAPLPPGRPAPREGLPAPGTDAKPEPSAPKPDARPRGGDDLSPLPDGDTGGDRHPQFVENAFTKVEGINALSTFGVDVDTASYSIVRKYLTLGQLPPASAVRLEEMVNYFPYADKPPEGDDPFAVTVQMADCPWEPAHRLVRLGLKAKPIANDKRPPSNLVFLIDVSGSMNEPNKLPLVKASLRLLVNQLGEKDRIAMVVYAGTTGVVLDSTPANKKEAILDALDRLEAGGSTNGSGGIQQAYEVAAAHFIKNGTNRVILCTDGDWNVGTTSTDALTKLIEEKRETGVFLSVFGFGMGNLRDEMLVKLAGKGNGNYGYIDTLKEAHKAFVEQMGGTLVTVAKDVKVQVEFNPAVVKSYRLLGYEKRILAAKDFHDDKKDAGEMGAGHVVTALYELVPAGAPDPVVGKVDGLRYQPEPAAPKAPAKAVKADEAFVVKMRHKKPDSDTSTLREMPVKDATVEYAKASEDFQFAAAVASFAMLLKDSPYKGHSNYKLVEELAGAATKHDPSGYRAEFLELVKKAKTLSGKP